jgi:flagellar basal body-associated protein FliL
MEPKTSPMPTSSPRKKIIIIALVVLVVIGVAFAATFLISKRKAAEQVAMLNFIQQKAESDKAEVYQQLLKFPQNPPTDKELSSVYQQLAKSQQAAPSQSEIKSVMDQLYVAEQAKAESLRQEYLASKKK